ncbi:MAG: PIN domain-containing protein [Steroidobacterales bacterium]
MPKTVPSETLVIWMSRQPDDNLYISSLTLAEIRRGILENTAGRKRTRLEAWFAGPEGPQKLFDNRVLPFDTKAALVWARLMWEGRAAGRPRNALDMIIAAVAEANQCMIVTDNEQHFPDIEVLNPLRLAP